MIRNDDLGYPIIIGRSLSDELTRVLDQRRRRAIVLTDRNTASLAAATTQKVQTSALREFALSERRKTFSTVEQVIDALIDAGVERDSVVIGVGGGVAGDLFGLAAALCMRGVDYVSVPTTLLAMVDAAIGGKTAVNLSRGKNLAGTVRQPIAVFCELNALRTLPYARLREGLAEVVKAAIIEGGRFFDLLEEVAPMPFPVWPWADVIEEAIKVKTMHVADESVDPGSREVLNLGHTFAHAIESASRYRISHGAAVAVGLRAAGLTALATGRFSRREHGRVLTLLALLGLPLRTSVEPGEILKYVSVDKKRRGGRVRFVLPLAIGDVEREVDVAPRVLRRVLAACVTPPSAREFV
ncbi:MAG: 3-dehydroquinate synthase [Candidatus Eremiobacteraeota bacterium]|nr:3-dehydroquinate synthase [Candidatus Eremiobacteraeota bacterium]